MKHIFEQVPDELADGLDYIFNEFEDLYPDIVLFGNRSYKAFGKKELLDVVKSNEYVFDRTAISCKELEEITGKPYGWKQITGCTQGEHQTIYFPKETSKEILETIECQYFGMYLEYIDLDENIGYTVLHCELNPNKSIKEILAEKAGYNVEEVTVRDVVGWHRTYDYKEF